MTLLSFLSTRTSAQGTPPLEYRTFDGSGNNLKHDAWGSTDTQLIRKVGSAYEDGLSEPRGGGINATLTLTSPRVVSNEVLGLSTSLFNAKGASHFLWQWGQFLDHDLDLTEAMEPPEPFHIPVPTGDPYFDPFSSGTALISLTRSIFDPATGQINPREQLNQITAWIDASQVYGSDIERANLLRSFEGGRLRSSEGNLLPFEADTIMFAAGDSRANEQIALTAMHTLLMREHNRLADIIAANHPSWLDEQIYQTARAIVGAEMQLITYKEFLPLLLGANALPEYTGYDEQIDPSISNEFSTAAYRVGHTMLPPILLRLDEQGYEIANGHVPLKDAFFAPQFLIDDGIDSILRGLAVEHAQEVDTQLVHDVRNFLFGQPSEDGFDLASFNIQRGRDHGLPSYNDVRVALGLDRVNDFADLTSDEARQEALANVYDNDVDQVDLWVGGLAEDHLNGSLVGETFHAIIVEQFVRLRDGDRFWHENIDWLRFDLQADPVVHQNGIKLSELQLSDIIRWNTTIDNIQDHVFLTSKIKLTAESGHDSIQLTWNSYNDPNLFEYQIWRALSDTQEFSVMATVRDTVSFDMELEEKTDYCYIVEASGKDGNSRGVRSNMACATFGHIALWVPDVWATAGEEAMIPVNIRNAHALQIAATDIWLDFDATIIEPLYVSPTALTVDYDWDYSFSTITDTEPYSRALISAFESNPPMLYGDGMLFWLIVEVKGTEQMSTTLNLREFIKPAGGTTIYAPNDLLNAIPLTLEDGTFHIGNEEECIYRMGDLNCNRVVEAADALIALQIASGQYPPTPQQEQTGDLNGNGIIDHADAFLIFSYAAHQTMPMPPTDEAIRGPSTIHLTLDEVIGAAGGVVSATLSASELLNWGGAGFDIVYDTALVAEIEDVTSTGLASDFQLAFYNDNGMLRIAQAYEPALSGDGALLTIRLRLADDAIDGSHAPLFLARAELNDQYGRDFVTSALQYTMMRESGSITIDNEPPILEIPNNIRLEATSSEGAVATFSVTANDNLDPKPTIACHPASGSTFPLGTTTVECSATDSAGNSTSASFNITVGDTTQILLFLPLVTGD